MTLIVENKLLVEFQLGDRNAREGVHFFTKLDSKLALT